MATACNPLQGASSRAARVGVQQSVPYFALLKALIGVLLLGLHGEAAAAIRAEGDLHFIRSQAGKSINQVLKFSVAVNECKWVIAIQDSYTQPHLTEIAYGHDGTNLYYLEKYAQDFRQVLDRDSAPLPPASGTVDYGSFPPFDFNHIVHLWFAYCSTCYLRTNDGVVPAALAYPAPAAERLRAQLRFAKTSEVFVNEADVVSGVNITLPDGTSSRRAWPYENGYVLLAYRVIQQTNLSGQAIPVKFLFHAFHTLPEGAKRSNDLALAWSLEGVATSVSFAEAAINGVPQLPIGTRITDYRVKGTDSTGYTTYRSSNFWLSPEDPRFKLVSAAMPAQVPSLISNGRTVVLLMMAALTLLAFAFGIRNLFSSVREHKGQ